MKVLVLGSTGMLGSMVAKVIPDEWEVLLTARCDPPMPYDHVNQRWRRFAVDHMAWQETLKELADGCDWIINCLGATKPLMDEGAAYTVNASFPKTLEETVQAPVIHASTDCVFRPGERATESRLPTADDPYGKSKGVADRDLSSTTILRCSIVGPECRVPARHLLGSVVEGRIHEGYAHHMWNGVTTLVWARMAVGIVKGLRWADWDSPLHVIPADSCSKDRLVSTIAQAFGMRGLWIEARYGDVVDMTLDTELPEAIEDLWEDAGYAKAQTIEEMIWDLADFCRVEQWPPSGVEGFRYWGKK